MGYSAVERVLRKNYSHPKIDPEKAGTLNTKNNSGQASFDSGTTFISIYGKAPTQRASTGRCYDKKHNFQFIRLDYNGNIRKEQNKAGCLTVGGHGAGNHSDMDVIVQLPRGYNKGGVHEKKAPTLSANAWERNNMVIQLNPSKESGGIQPYQQNRVYDINGKSPALMADMSCGAHAVLEKSENRLNLLGNIYDNGHNSQSGRVYATNGKSTAKRGEAGGGGAKTGLYMDGARIRRLTPTECARLQTIPEWYEWVCSETQQYRMLGNGWTVEIIKHILSFAKWK